MRWFLAFRGCHWCLLKSFYTAQLIINWFIYFSDRTFWNVFRQNVKKIHEKIGDTCLIFMGTRINVIDFMKKLNTFNWFNKLPDRPGFPRGPWSPGELKVRPFLFWQYTHRKFNEENIVLYDAIKRMIGDYLDHLNMSFLASNAKSIDMTTKIQELHQKEFYYHWFIFVKTSYKLVKLFFFHSLVSFSMMLAIIYIIVRVVEPLYQ